MSVLLDAALGYSRKGHRVLPVLGKSPLLLEWPKRASSDPQQVQAWWGRWPNANVGLLCGERYAVLDVDPRHGGDESLAALVAAHGPLPDTVTDATGGGGLHFYFSARKVPSARPAPGLELRSVGQQVLAPPSIHPDTGREYVWLAREPLAPLPAWLANRPGGRGPILADDQPLVPIGARHDALVRFLGLLRSCGFGEAALVAFVDPFLDHCVEVDEARCPLDRNRAYADARQVARCYPPYRTNGGSA